jgi:hypothetical protein
VLTYNKQFEPLVASGKCAFVPRSHQYSAESTSDYSITKYLAPIHQAATHIGALPFNRTALSQAHSGGSQPERLIAELTLPSFQGLDLRELARLAENETEAFIKFNHFLSARLEMATQAQTPQILREILAEITYEVANLQVEAKKIAKLRSLQAAQLVLFTLSLSISLSTDMDVLKGIAGVMGSVSFLEVLKAYFGYQQEQLSLRKSDFYLPFLFGKQK